MFNAVIDHAHDLSDAGKKVIIACWSEGSADRMRTVLSDHSGGEISHAANWAAVQSGAAGLQTAILALEGGFETDDAAFISEQDILGDRLVRRSRRKRAENFQIGRASCRERV